MTAGGWAVSEPYYSQCTRSVCVSPSAFFITQEPWEDVHCESMYADDMILMAESDWSLCQNIWK